jgi:predicted dehydrogenase
MVTFAQANQSQNKKIRIAIIGAENSHTRGFGRMFNRDKKFPRCEVLYVWGETEAFAKDAQKRGYIPNIVKDPQDMLGKIYALIVDHRHPKYHLAPALPFVKAGIPTFIDKPFCYRVEEGKEFLRIAREHKTPVTSFSSIAHSAETFDIAKQVKLLEGIEHITRYGPADINSKYGGIFLYVVHTFQPLMYIFGEDIERVKMQTLKNKASASVVFSSGLFATLIFSNGKGWGTSVILKDGEKQLTSKVEKSNPSKNYVDMVEMFQTGKEPRSHESILKCVAVLQALEKSVISQEWEEVTV